MATAEELLAAEGCADILTVNLNTRTIVIPNTVTNIGVENDDDVRLLHFQLPRHYCQVDLSEFDIHINYENAKGEPDVYEVRDAVIGDDLIAFDWLVGRHAFISKGNVKFSVCLKDTSDGVIEREFNTTTATLPVLAGLETEEAIIQEYPDIFEQMREDLKKESGLDTSGVTEGSILCFVNGAPVWASVENSAIATYIDKYINDALGGEY